MAPKRLLSIVIAFSLLFTLCACAGKNGSDKASDGTADSGWKDGKLSAPGDVFEAPEIKSASGAPVIAQINKQVDPGSSFTVTGEGFTSAGLKAYLYSQSTADNGRSNEAELTVVDDNTAMITVDSSLDYGIYSVHLQNSAGKSNSVIINCPKIWWTDITTANEGDIFSVYGENLTTDNGNSAYAYLVAEDGRYKSVEITYADPYKISFKVPSGLKDGKEYTIKVHNGHGGDSGFATADEKLIFQEEEINAFNGEVIDVTEYGADPANDNGDDSAAISDAVAAAADGDTLYFPAGVYLMDSAVTIDKNLKISGEGKDKVTFVMGDIASGGMFKINGYVSEFERVGFWDVRTTEFTANFIKYDGDGSVGNTPNLNVHNCRFVQHTDSHLLSGTKSINISKAGSILIQNNQFEGTGILLSHNVEKLFINNNVHAGTFYCGQFYGQTSIVLWNTSGLDSSYNEFYAKGTKDHEVGEMGSGDYTSGRMFGIQQHCRNLYIANSTTKNTGLPGDNAGEQIMLENVSTVYDGLIASATENTVTLPEGLNLQVSSGSIVTVVEGKGVTQWAYVTGQTGNILTLDHDLAITPDSTSRVYISYCMDNVAIYKNSFNCFTNYGVNATATCGIQIYSNAHNLFATHNTMQNMAYGVCITSFYKYKEGSIGQQRCGAFWSQIDNNTISDVNIGIRYVVETYTGTKYGNHPGCTSFGVTVKNNQISNIYDFIVKNKQSLGGAGVLMGTPNYEYIGWSETCTWNGKCIYGALIENNTISNCEKANIMLYKHQSGTALIGNEAKDSIADVYTVDSKGNAPAAVK